MFVIHAEFWFPWQRNQKHLNILLLPNWLADFRIILKSKILENPWSIVIFFVTKISKYLDEWVGAIMIIHLFYMSFETW